VTYSLFGITFEMLKNTFNNQKIRFKKIIIITRLVKKIKNAFKGLKSLKIVQKKNTFDKSLKMKLLSKSSF
jgi:hypothetical protein